MGAGIIGNRPGGPGGTAPSLLNGSGPRLTRIQSAWLAALIDGEGCILFSKRYRGITLQVTNTAVSLLNFVMSVTGVGSITRNDWKNRKTKWSDAYRWRIAARDSVLRLLRSILPYLIVKRDKARRAIALLTA